MHPRCPRCHSPLQVAVHLTGLYSCPRKHDGRTAFWRESGGALVRADAEADRLARKATRGAMASRAPASSQRRQA